MISTHEVAQSYSARRGLLGAIVLEIADWSMGQCKSSSALMSSMARDSRDRKRTA